MKRTRSTGKPTIVQQQRIDAITKIGCIVCDALGHGFMPCQVHRLLVGGKYGQPRRGHDFTIGLCPWHHVGEPMAGLSHSACADRYGPSYARDPRRFRQEIGTDDYLLDLQNTMIEQHRGEDLMATRRRTFGIDPGLSGAVATLIDGAPGPILDMPTREVDGWKEVDARAVATFIRAQREAHPGAELQAALEKVGARPGDGGTSAFHFGDSYSHPPEDVSTKNWRDYAIGHTGDEVAHDKTRVRVPLVLMDQAAIDDFDAGKRELSQGYSAEIVWEDGITPEGEPYDAKVKNIRNNHLALARRGRAGSQFRIGAGRIPGAPDPSAHPQPQETSSIIQDPGRVVHPVTIPWRGFCS